MRWKNQGGQAAVTVTGQADFSLDAWQHARFVQVEATCRLEYAGRQ